MIYTSYYGKYKGTQGVAISRTIPYGYKCEVYKPLAPTRRLLQWFSETDKGLDAQEQYRQIYYQDVLNHLNPDEVYRALDGKVLLCYEKTGVFCHRHLVAEWLNKNGYKCEEF